MAFIYALIDPRTDEIRYIGKANDVMSRYKRHFSDMRKRDYPVYRWMNKLLCLGLEPLVATLENCQGKDWRKVEKRLIAEAGINNLLNVAEGGDEPHQTREQRSKNGTKTIERRREQIKPMVEQELTKYRESPSEQTKSMIEALMTIMPKDYKESIRECLTTADQQYTAKN